MRNSEARKRSEEREAAQLYACDGCGRSVTRDGAEAVTGGRLCPSWTRTLHEVNPAALPLYQAEHYNSAGAQLLRSVTQAPGPGGRRPRLVGRASHASNDDVRP